MYTSHRQTPERTFIRMTSHTDRRIAKRAPKRFYGDMTFEKAEQMRHLYFTRQKKQAELGRIYGIRQGSVSRILSGLSWAR